MTTATASAYDQLIKHSKDVTALGTTIAILHWDQEVKMPPKGIEYRADQIAVASRLFHEMKTSSQGNDLLQACEEDSNLMANPLSAEAVNVREIRHAYDRATKLPTQVVVKALGQKHEKTMTSKSFNPGLKKLFRFYKRRQNVMVGLKVGNHGMHLQKITNRVARLCK